MTDPVGTKLPIQLQNGPMIGQRLIVVTDHFNPYCQILENSSRNFSKIFNFRVMTQTVYLENSSNFFSKFQFWGRELDRLPGKLIH